MWYAPLKLFPDVIYPNFGGQLLSSTLERQYDGALRNLWSGETYKAGQVTLMCV
jgi:hypothetical protein